MNSQTHEFTRRRPRVLRLVLEIPETNAPYQALSLPLAERHEITICTFFRAALEVPNTIRLFEGNGTVMGFVRVLRAALRSGSYDIIHAHTPHVAVVFLAIALFRPALLRSSVFTAHSCYENHKLRNKVMLLPVFVLFRRIICCSQSAFNSFPHIYRWLAGRRLKVVPNGVHTDRIHAVRDQLNGASAHDDFTIISVGRMVPIKNLSTTLAAFSRTEPGATRLVFVGDGPLRDTMAQTSHACGLASQVQFTALLARDDVYHHLLQSDLYISTSHGEGLPVAALEAMACGCPVVLSDIAPHREIAESVDFIPLVPSDDVCGFARQIDRFRQMTPSERTRIGDMCAQLVRNRFSLEAMHSGYEQIYQEVMV